MFPIYFQYFWLRIEKISEKNHQAVTRSVVVLARSASTERKTTSKALVQPSTKKDKLINWAPLQHGRTEWHNPPKKYTQLNSNYQIQDCDDDDDDDEEAEEEE